VETAFLMQGLLTAREYFNTENAEEHLLSNRLHNFGKTVEWNGTHKEPILYIGIGLKITVGK
jgi:hypothetical protein